MDKKNLIIKLFKSLRGEKYSCLLIVPFPSRELVSQIGKFIFTHHPCWNSTFVACFFFFLQANLNSIKNKYMFEISDAKHIIYKFVMYFFGMSFPVKISRKCFSTITCYGSFISFVCMTSFFYVFFQRFLTSTLSLTHVTNVFVF